MSMRGHSCTHCTAVSSFVVLLILKVTSVLGVDTVNRGISQKMAPRYPVREEGFIHLQKSGTMKVRAEGTEGAFVHACVCACLRVCVCLCVCTCVQAWTGLAHESVCLDPAKWLSMDHREHLLLLREGEKRK